MSKIAILSGDGVGPEIMTCAASVIDAVGKYFDFKVTYESGLIGGAAYDQYGHPFPETTRQLIEASDAVLLGAVGGPKWDDVESSLRPESGLLSLRKHMSVYCNIRPIISFPVLNEMSPLKLDGHLDICFVRELTGGIYFGEKGVKYIDGKTCAYDIKSYDNEEISRIAKKAYEIASSRQGKLTSVDKSNVLQSSKLWRRTVTEMKDQYTVDLDHMYVDNAAMQLIKNPQQFDVILTGNMFGDILSDEASVLSGSIGVLPSASIGDDKGLYEPIHGSAPDIAGLNIANPIGMILSVALMYKYSFNRGDIHDFIFQSVEETLNQGYGTKDLSLMDMIVTTNEWTEKLIENMKEKND